MVGKYQNKAVVVIRIQTAKEINSCTSIRKTLAYLAIFQTQNRGDVIAADLQTAGWLFFTNTINTALLTETSGQ